MSPAKPPDGRKRLSYADASKVVIDAEAAKSPHQRERSVSFAGVSKGTQSNASPEPPASVWPPLPLTSDSSRATQSWEPAHSPAQSEPLVSYAGAAKSPAQSEPSISHAEADKTPSKTGTADASLSPAELLKIAHRKSSLELQQVQASSSGEASESTAKRVVSPKSSAKSWPAIPSAGDNKTSSKTGTGNSPSPAEVLRLAHRKSSLELQQAEASSQPTTPVTEGFQQTSKQVSPKSSAKSWPAMPSAGDNKAPRKISGSDASMADNLRATRSTVSRKLFDPRGQVAPTTSSQSRPAISYADVARPRKSAQAHMQATQQPRSSEKPKPVDAAVSAAPVPVLPPQTTPSTPELLDAIEKLVKTTDVAWKSESPKTSSVLERKRQPWARVPDTPADMAEPSKKAAESPQKNIRPLTWAGVVKGRMAEANTKKPTTRPPTPFLEPATTLLQPVTPLIRPATPYLPSPTPHRQPGNPQTNVTESPTKSKKAQARKRAKENSRQKAASEQQTGSRPGTSSSTQSTSAKTTHHASKQPGKQKTKAKNPKSHKKDPKKSPSKGKGKGKALPSPVASKANLPSSEARANPNFEDWSWEVVPHAGHLASTLKRKQEEELAQKQGTSSFAAQYQPSSTSTAAWPPSRATSSAFTMSDNQAPVNTGLDVSVSSPPLTTGWQEPPSTTIESTFGVPSSYQPGNDPTPGRSPPEHQLTVQGSPAADGEEAVRRERERSAMRRGIRKTKANLWQFQFGWDVLVECDNARWRVHRQILGAGSPWFAGRLPPPDPAKPYTVFDCSGHDPSALGHALWFMYHGLYTGASLPSHDQLDGDCIRKNVYMYICGASVNCEAMTKFALNAIERTTETLAQIVSVKYLDMGLHRLFVPLGQALELLRFQGNRPNTFPIRLAVARLVDVTLPYLMKNASFRYAFEANWRKELYPMCWTDSVLFRQMGLIGQPHVGDRSREEAAGTDAESGEETVIGAQRGDETEEDDDSTPRAERKQKDAAMEGDAESQQEEDRGYETDPYMQVYESDNGLWLV